MAFQMRDDYLDLMGASERLGKPVGGDVREGKVTLITLWLLDAEPERVGKVLLRRGREPDDVAFLRELAERTGVAERVVEAIGERIRRALAALEVLPGSEAKAALEGLALAELKRLQ